MILTYHTGQCIRASAGDTAVVFGPVSKSSKKFKPTNFGADVAFVSINHADANGSEEASRGDKNAFVISGPGEYEVKDIVASGFATVSNYGGGERINTMYHVLFDGLHVLYAGALSSTDIPSDILEMDSPDILIVSLGEGLLTPAEAHKLSVKLEAKVTIPLTAEGDEKMLKQFLKEAGAESAAPADKFTVKPRDVAGKSGEVVVLSA